VSHFAEVPFVIGKLHLPMACDVLESDQDIHWVRNIDFNLISPVYRHLITDKKSERSVLWYSYDTKFRI
jgi:hypothetical protein